MLMGLRSQKRAMAWPVPAAARPYKKACLSFGARTPRQAVPRGYSSTKRGTEKGRTGKPGQKPSSTKAAAMAAGRKRLSLVMSRVVSGFAAALQAQVLDMLFVSIKDSEKPALLGEGLAGSRDMACLHGEVAAYGVHFL